MGEGAGDVTRLSGTRLVGGAAFPSEFEIRWSRPNLGDLNISASLLPEPYRQRQITCITGANVV